MKNRSNFTLLEAVIALIVLAVGLGLFMAQFALAGRRVMDNYAEWKSLHELANATEYILSVRPDAPLAGAEDKFFAEEFLVVRSWEEIQLPDDFENDNNGAMRLVNLKVEVKDKSSGEVIEDITIPCWVEAEYAP